MRSTTWSTGFERQSAGNPGLRASEGLGNLTAIPALDERLTKRVCPTGD
jgi:hypothetical protein